MLKTLKNCQNVSSLVAESAREEGKATDPSPCDDPTT